ncbi:MAG: helicase-associated domain-containing protein [Phycisphaeraceae bacterium]
MNIDWAALADTLGLWGELAPDDRHAFVSLKPGKTMPATAFSDAGRQRMVEANVLALISDRQRVRLHPDGRELSKVMRAMHRHRLHTDSSERDLADYASDHLTTEERRALLHGHNYGSFYAGTENYHLVTRRDWPQQVLELRSTKAALKWEREHLPEGPASARAEDGAPYFEDKKLLDAARKLLDAAMRWPQPVRLAELPEHVPDLEPALLWCAVMPVVRYLMLFPWLEDETFEPVLGLWPEVTHVLHRPAPRRPRSVEPAEVFHAPLLIEDMQAVLVGASAEPPRVLASGDGLYARDVKRLTETFIAMPPWLVGDGADMDELAIASRERDPVESRLMHATQCALDMELLEPRKSQKRVWLEVTDKGRDWLASDMRERIRAMAEPWRAEPEATGRGKAKRRDVSTDVMLEAMGMDWDGDQNVSPWAPPSLRWGAGPDLRKIDWRGAFVDMLTDADGQFAALPELLEYHSRVNNPLLGRRAEGSYGPTPRLRLFGQREASETQLEALWQRMAEDRIFQALVPLGGVELACTGETLALRLHAIGRYMLGLADDFDWQAPAEGDVIVQPNFEVIFLGPAPRAEAKIGRLAERTGSGGGTMFCITRDSILAAAAAGVTADDALRDLDELTSKPLPDNVKREVCGWFEQTRRVHMRQAWLINAPDKHTAERIVAAGGKQARQHTDTLVEITAAKKDHSAIVRKLKRAGLFVQ